tara:strand:- start:1310 stop:2311 length:1002 start_codon:yes stop_codon:yes gene_type:complete
MVKTSIVVTTIFEPNEVIHKLVDISCKNNIRFFIAGDKKTPNSYHNLDCNFMPLTYQNKSYQKFSQSLPLNHYVRKNISYLESFKSGAERIIETDDDNYPLENFLSRTTEKLECDVVSGSQWINAYKFFTDDKIIWPRGYPLEKIKDESTLKKDNNFVNAPIQQGLANNNPDVDAIFRMVYQLPFVFNETDDIALDEFCWCPFNSQVTTWFKNAFPLMYLPSTCTFRMTDIWRSFIAQRILWENQSKLLFHSASVKQKRNEHNLLKDFKDEVPGYQNNQLIIDYLTNLKLKKGWNNTIDNMFTCYEKLISIKIFEPKEIEILTNWSLALEDIY